MPSDLSQRSMEAELMDTKMVSIDDFNTCLKQIERVNSLTLGYRPVFLWLEKHLSSHATQNPLTIMDIGCGRGEMLRRIWRWAKAKKINVRLIGLDINPLSKAAAGKATPEDMDITYQTANILETGSAQRADFIICSHVTHHLKDDELVRFLQWLNRHSLKGWFIVDLHRHFIPHVFIKHILSLTAVNPMVRNDGPASVRRAFTGNDWRKILHQANISPSQYRIRWFFPFRYGIAVRNNSCTPIKMK